MGRPLARGGSNPEEEEREREPDDTLLRFRFRLEEGHSRPGGIRHGHAPGSQRTSGGTRMPRTGRRTGARSDAWIGVGRPSGGLCCCLNQPQKLPWVMGRAMTAAAQRSRLCAPSAGLQARFGFDACIVLCACRILASLLLFWGLTRRARLFCWINQSTDRSSNNC